MGIIIAAIITATLSAACYGGVLYRLAPPSERRFLTILCALQLPMSAVTFYLVRRPLDAGLHAVLGDLTNSLWFRTFYAPLTEEPAKLWPLLIPAFARRVTRANAVRAAVALGLGFGLGEIALLATLLAAEGRYSALPWYSFGGFLNERFMVCLTHGGFTALAICGWRRRGSLPLGLLGAMGAHFIGNSGITLAAVGAFGPNEAVRTTVLSLWVSVPWIICLIVLPTLNQELPLTRQSILGESTCPECGQAYPRPLLAMNLGTRRFERCPHCHHWHMVSLLRRGRQGGT